MKRNRVLIGLVVTAILGWGGYLAYRAHANLVTLQVREMDVRRVVSKLEWQTWERILVSKGVAGRVTLNVRSVPLDQVLDIVALQTGSRWTALYPIYLTKKSAVAFQQTVRGEIAPEKSGWSKLEKVLKGQPSNLGGFASTLRGENKVVSARIANKDLSFAAFALSRFSHAEVVPEDGATGTINLQLDQAPFEKAVAQVAKQAHRRWQRLYALYSQRSMVVMNQGVNANQPVKVTAAPIEEDASAPAREMEAFLATMTPEERKKAEEQMAVMQQLRSLPPAERQQRMQQMAAQGPASTPGSDLLDRIQNRLKNGTVEQRVAKDREKIQSQQRSQKP